MSKSLIRDGLHQRMHRVVLARLGAANEYLCRYARTIQHFGLPGPNEEESEQLRSISLNIPKSHALWQKWGLRKPLTRSPNAIFIGTLMATGAR